MATRSKLKLRSTEELEGALLPPPPPLNPQLMTPFPLQEYSPVESIPAAVPIGQSEYALGETLTTQSINAAVATPYNQEMVPLTTSTEEISTNQGYFEGSFETIGNEPRNRYIPMAHHVPVHNEMSAEKRSLAEREMAEFGSAIGRISNSTSNEVINKGIRDTSRARDWHIKEKLKKATRNARQRDKEGFTSEQDSSFDKNLFTETNKIQDSQPDKDKTHASKNEPSGGYEISEYKMSDYSGMEYDTSYEYKSVYDK